MCVGVANVADEGRGNVEDWLVDPTMRRSLALTVLDHIVPEAEDHTIAKLYQPGVSRTVEPRVTI